MVCGENYDFEPKVDLNLLIPFDVHLKLGLIDFPSKLLYPSIF